MRPVARGSVFAGLFLGAGLLVLACAAGSDGESSLDGSSGDADGGGYDDDGLSSGDGDFASGTGGAFGLGGSPSVEELPEEIEDETSYRAPVATGRYLWSANPTSGRVALIDVVDVTVQVLSAGLYPTYLSAIPHGGEQDAPHAIVLNTGSSDATRFRVNAGKIETDKVPTHPGANQWSISKSGKWAVAYSAPEPGQVLDPTEGLQEMTVIALGDDKMTETRLTVGYRPSHAQVAEDDQRLIVVSEEGITIISLLGTPTQVGWINLGIEEETRDVSLSRDGNYALVRRSGASSVELIDLKDPSVRKELVFSDRVTDVDLSPSGRAVAVIRWKSELATFRIQDVLVDPTDIDTLHIDGEFFGSAALTEDGERVVLYMNVLPTERINIVDLSADHYLEHRALSTKSPVYSVTTTPDGHHGVVLSATEKGNPGEAFAVVSLSTERFPRIVGTGAAVSDVALANDFGIVTARSALKETYESYLISLPGLSVTQTKLSTLPLSAGVMSDVGLAYVAQSHPEGRVTFFSDDAETARTLTGFELSAEVIDE